MALSRTRHLIDLVILDPTLDWERFRTFFRGLNDQREECKRLGIYDEEVGDDTAKEYEFDAIESDTESSENFETISEGDKTVS